MELEVLQGTISAVVYQNYDNGYTVLRLSLGGGQTATVVGTIPLPTVGVINLSEIEDLITFMWADEAFDPAKPDTYFEKV